MREKSLISVIIPIFNGEKYIERCIRSLESQTYTYFEIILINDGSSDRTETLCQAMKDKNQNIKYYYQDNAGVAAARNLGMRYASGQYIMFVDCDDYLYPTYIEDLYTLIIKLDTQMACCSYFKGNADEINIFLKQNHENEQKVLLREEALASLFYRREIMGYPFCKLFARGILKGVSFKQNMRFGEDFLFVYEILKKSTKVAFVNRNLYFYSQNESSATHNLKYEDMKFLWYLIKDKMFVEMNGESAAIGQAVRSKLLILAIDYLTRMKDMEYDEAFQKELLDYIDHNCSEVLKDRKNKFSSRILALFGRINKKWTVSFCYYCLKFFKKIGFQRRKAM